MEVLYHSGPKDGDPGQILNGCLPHDDVQIIIHPASEGMNEKDPVRTVPRVKHFRRTPVNRVENGPGAGHGFYFLLT